MELYGIDFFTVLLRSLVLQMKLHRVLGRSLWYALKCKDCIINLTMAQILQPTMVLHGKDAMLTD